MKANWSVYPDNLGHMIWPGCFRCHDGNHKAEDGKRPSRQMIATPATRFWRRARATNSTSSPRAASNSNIPADDYDISCSDCHTGGP